MSYQFYDTFTIEETNKIGTKFKVICRANYCYEGQLTIDKEYEIEIVEKIMPLSPLCSFINDKGLSSCAHLSRFKKVVNND